MSMPDIQGLINYNKETPYYTTQRITSFSPQMWAILEDVNACFLKVTPWNTDSTRLSFINLEDSIVTLSSTLAWRIPWTDRHSRLKSIASQRAGYDWSDLASMHTHTFFIKRVLLVKYIEVKVTQSRPILCDPMDYTVLGILQARILEWGAFPFSRGSSQPRDQTQVSRIAGRFFINWATREATLFGRIVMHRKVLGPLLQTILSIQCTYSFSLDLRYFLFSVLSLEPGNCCLWETLI